MVILIELLIISIVLTLIMSSTVDIEIVLRDKIQIGISLIFTKLTFIPGGKGQSRSKVGFSFYTGLIKSILEALEVSYVKIKRVELDYMGNGALRAILPSILIPSIIVYLKDRALGVDYLDEGSDAKLDITVSLRLFRLIILLSKVLYYYIRYSKRGVKRNA